MCRFRLINGNTFEQKWFIDEHVKTIPEGEADEVDISSSRTKNLKVEVFGNNRQGHFWLALAPDRNPSISGQNGGEFTIGASAHDQVDWNIHGDLN